MRYQGRIFCWEQTGTLVVSYWCYSVFTWFLVNSHLINFLKFCKVPRRYKTRCRESEFCILCISLWAWLAGIMSLHTMYVDTNSSVHLYYLGLEDGGGCSQETTGLSFYM